MATYNTYNSYVEAKINNPDKDIFTYGNMYQSGDSPCKPTEWWKKCNPSDYCMAVEKFLADGHKFAEGDAYLNYLGEIKFIGSSGYGADACNDVKNIVGANASYILRASALEEQPTPTKFVKVEESIFDLKGEFERGELYTKGRGAGGNFFRSITTESELITLASCGLYRQVEIDWRDEVKEAYDAVELPVGELGRLYMGEGWSEQEFIKFCHLVASLTEKPANG